MVGVGAIGVSDPEIVDDKTENEVARRVMPKARR
jgi:hypothetical protein